MDRVFESGAIGSAPSAPASPSSGYPTAGNPSTATPATKPGSYWFHQVTEELRAVITGAGITPSHTDLDQLKEAIDALILKGGLNSGGIILLNANATLTAAAHLGKTVLFDGTASGAFTVTLPLANTAANGSRIHFQNVSSFNVTVQRQGSNVIYPNNASVTSIVVGPGDTLTVEAYNGASWFAVDGTKQLGYSASFGSSMLTNGYQKLPSGLIIQWGQATMPYVASSYSSLQITLPVSYLSSQLFASAVCVDSGNKTTSGRDSIAIDCVSQNNSSFVAYIDPQSASLSAAFVFKWFSIGI